MNVRTVSIICPLFNEEKFIERCILSILEQDYPQDKLEVLLIDGRSTDHTADIVRRYPGARGAIRPKQGSGGCHRRSNHAY